MKIENTYAYENYLFLKIVSFKSLCSLNKLDKVMFLDGDILIDGQSFIYKIFELLQEYDVVEVT